MKLECFAGSRRLCTYMSKLFFLNDNITSIHQSIEEASQTQLSLKVECQKALNGYKNFLKEQEEMRNKRLEEICPDTVK